ncbi:BnaC04g01220D [Brassica napus]|uniref:BnaC04g01220D protein n=1 Tax=Brassica napus TaxID=3708 RepID=A0A078HXI1_BRANA|nr:BnaC04g01220D [Brassica napus]
MLSIPSNNNAQLEYFKPKNKPSIVNVNSFLHPREKVVFVMGATGSGKSRLAIDLATRRASPLARGSGSRAHNMI